MDLCLLHIDHQDIGIPMDAVREVLIHPAVNPLPLAPDFLQGVTSFRGMCLPVIELTGLIHQAEQLAARQVKKHQGSRDRVVVCQHDQSTFGLRVDQVGRRNIPAASTSDEFGQELVKQIDIPEQPELTLLNLPQLFKTMTQLMKPQLQHLS
jgi:chemotaxis signal transduction protein